MCNTMLMGKQKFTCYETKIEESKKAGNHRKSNTRQPDNHQHPQSSTHTAQVVLNASVPHLAATQYVLSAATL